MDERTLSEADLDRDPIRQFERWLDEAWQAGEPLANAMALATTAPDGTPTVRMVLLTAVDERGFAFETNIASPKAQHLERQARAALLFFWPRLVRQVRIVGTVTSLPRDDVLAYFRAAPREIQAMLRACRQSEPVADRQTLERRWSEAMAELEPSDPEMPSDWGGYRVMAETIEFWQGRANRLQDRLRLTHLPDGSWHVERLMP